MSAVEPDRIRPAVQLISAGQFDQAERILKKLLSDHPDDEQLLIYMGLCRHGQGNVNKALGFFERAVAANDNSATAHFYHGRVLADLDQTDRAREALAQALALNPNHVEARTMMGLISLHKHGDLERASSELRTALRADADYVPALSGLARVLAMQGQLQEAEKLASRAIQLNPNNAETQAAMALIFSQRGRLDFAEQCLRNALKLQPKNGELHANLAYLLVQRGRYQEASPHFGEAIMRNFGGVRTIIDASVNLARIGNPQEAWRLLEQAYQRWPEDEDLRLALAQYRLRGGDADAAQELIADLDQQRFVVRVTQARIHYASGQTDQAMALLDALIDSDVDEDVRIARLLKAELAVQNDDSETAETALAPLLESNPPNAEAVQAWVDICRRFGKLDLAIEPVKRLLQEADFGDAPSAAVAQARLHQLLAELNNELDRPEQALMHLGRTAWRPMSIAGLLKQQQENAGIRHWLEHTEDDSRLTAPEDGLPAPIIVAGWPGSGRSLILAALLEASDQIIVLDPEMATSRREALGLPFGREELMQRHESIQLTARKRYMRSLDRSRLPRPVLDTAWYEMSAIPALAYNFPGLTVLWPEFDPRDLELHFRFSGYQEVSVLRDQLEQELTLAKQLSQQLPVRVIRIQRQDLFEAPQLAIEKIADGIGIDVVPAMQARLEMARENELLLPDGRWKAYQPLFESDQK